MKHASLNLGSKAMSHILRRCCFQRAPVRTQEPWCEGPCSVRVSNTCWRLLDDKLFLPSSGRELKNVYLKGLSFCGTLVERLLFDGLLSKWDSAMFAGSLLQSSLLTISSASLTLPSVVNQSLSPPDLSFWFSVRFSSMLLSSALPPLLLPLMKHSS